MDFREGGVIRSVWYRGVGASPPYTQTHAPPLHSMTLSPSVVHADAEAIAAGASHSMVLQRDGTVWATGCRKFGQLGDGRDTHYIRNTPRERFAKVVSSGQCYTKGVDRHKPHHCMQ